MRQDTIPLAVDRIVWNVVKKELVGKNYGVCQDTFANSITEKFKAGFIKQNVRSFVYQTHQISD